MGMEPEEVLDFVETSKRPWDGLIIKFAEDTRKVARSVMVMVSERDGVTEEPDRETEWSRLGVSSFR